ncbi:MAG: DUF87 domain-containing protein [Anaerolineae bacterium]|nr:DUF87 domain-containing protein [Anaerolineae bacterium]
MSRYDDDYDDEDERDDDDEIDDEGGVRRSTSNPFSRPSTVRGAGLPARPQPTQSGTPPTTPSPIRSGGLGGPNNPPNRTAGPAPSGVQPYQRNPVPPRTPGNRDDQTDDPNDRSAAVNRALGSFGQKLGSDRSSERDDERVSGNPSRFGGRERGDERDDRSSGLTRGLGGQTTRLGGNDERTSGGMSGNPSRLGDSGSGDERSPGGASRLGGGDRRDERTSSGFGAANRSTYGGTSEKTEEKRGGIGGLTSRFGGKKDEKPSAKQNDRSGGGLGGLTSRFGGGKKDDKPSAFGSSTRQNDRPGGLGGLTSRFGGGKKDDKPGTSGAPKQGGGLGGLTSRFGGGKKEEKQPTAGASGAFGSSRLGDQSSRQQSPLGGTLSRGNKPEPSSSAFGSSSGARSSYGAAGGARTTGAQKQSLGERLRGLNPFQKKEEARPARARASKAPRVEQGGLSLDSKLDIIGVTLVLGSLVLLLSSLSPTKGALTESINHRLSYAFGWGAMFVLFVTFAIGVWLILRHFGDDAPTISRTRLIGLGLLFVSLLVLAQFIDAFQYKVGPGQDYLRTIKMAFLEPAYELGRGGGWVGGEIYFLLLSNFGEIGGFLVVFIPVIVGLMLALNVSAADLAMILISNGRNLRDAMHQRQQRIAAERAEKQQVLATATQQISVSKPAEALPTPVSPALPAPAAAEVSSRRIPITTAGRTSSVPFRAPEMAEAAPQPIPVAEEKSGGLFSRVRSIMPGRDKPETEKPVEKPVQQPVQQPAAEKASALRGRLFAGRQQANGSAVGTVAAVVAGAAAALLPDPDPVPETPAAVAPAQPQTPPLQAQAAEASTPAKPTPAATPTPQPEDKTPRLSDLLRRQTPATPGAPPGGVQPYPRPQRPELTPSGERKPNGIPAGTPAAFPIEAPAEAPAARISQQAPEPRSAEPMPDLQSRMRTLRESTTGGATAPPPRAPLAEPPRSTASPAFGKPPDLPSAQPTRSTHAPSSDVTPPPQARRPKKDWKLPDPSALLATGVDQAPDHEMLLKRAHIIEETLSSFGAPGRVVDVRTGPVVTQFGVEPDYVPGRGGKKNRVKVGAIAALDKDLQLALGAKAIRIEAPVPGKGYVGVEVPNEKAEIVHLRDVLESPEFKKIKSPLAIALGQGVDGTPVAADLGSMPHLLIAGTTGSGKSVLVNAIIAGLLLNNPPQRMKFIMVDPKRVELTQYNGVPHLVAPVVVELERIVSVLKWVTREMDERYRKFSNAAARNIEDYNKHLPATEEQMPYIVVIIDELADLMMLAPDETERVITRIAALARATGIHLVIATQRPSVDVVTGLIKANFPARVAFAVAGNTDSRVILDQPGAERLLGRGDMLWMSGDSPAPVRLQGVYVSDNEINNITHFWRSQMTQDDLIAASRPIGGSLSPDDSSRSEGGGVIMRSNAQPKRADSPRPATAFWDDDEDEDDTVDDENDPGDGEDELYEQAVEMVRRLNKASVSLLQRRLRIGYTRAARLIDMMEERGIVGPATEGSKPREVLPVR